MIQIKKKYFFLTSDCYLVEMKPNSLSLNRWVNLKSPIGLSLCIYDNKYIGCGCGDGIIRLFNAETLQHYTSINKLYSFGKVVELNQKSPNNVFADIIAIQYNIFYNKLITIYSDKALFIWDINSDKTCSIYRSYIFHFGSIICMDYDVDPDNNVLKLTKSGFSKPGYYTIDLGKLITLNEGDVFDPITEIKLFTNDKAGKAGRAKWYITSRSVITTATEYIDQWKVIVSSANAGGQKRSNQLEIVDNHSAFGRSRVALKAFSGEDAQQQAENFYNYVQSELIRFAFLMTDESLTSLAKHVPDIVDYSNNNGYIDFSGDINAQVYELFGIREQAQIDYIRSVLAKKADGLDDDDSDEQEDIS